MAKIVCPAGQAVGEMSKGGQLCSACVCRVTQTVVTPVDDPTTFHRRCTREPGFAPARADNGAIVSAPDGYTACNVWRADKGNRFAAKLADGDGDWWQINKRTGRIEYIDADQRARSVEEELAL